MAMHMILFKNNVNNKTAPCLYEPNKAVQAYNNRLMVREYNE